MCCYAPITSAMVMQNVICHEQSCVLWLEQHWWDAGVIADLGATYNSTQTIAHLMADNPQIWTLIGAQMLCLLAEHCHTG